MFTSSRQASNDEIPVREPRIPSDLIPYVLSFLNMDLPTIYQILLVSKHMNVSIQNEVYWERAYKNHNTLFKRSNVKSWKEECKRFVQYIQQERLQIRIMFLGVGGIGKSTLVSMYLFNDDRLSSRDTCHYYDYKMDFIQNEKQYELVLIDTVGQEEYRPKDMLQDANAFVIMYDVNSRQSFEECAKFADIVRTHKGNAPIVVTGNKLDIALENRMVLMQDGEDFAKKYNAKFFEISAMLKTNTDKVLDQIVTEVQAIRNPPAVKSKKCSVM